MNTGTKVNITADFSLETMQMRRWQGNINKVPKEKKMSTRILYSVKISFKNKDKIFFRHTKAKRIHHQQIFTARNVKGNPLDRRKMTPDGKYESAQKNEEQQKYYVHRKISFSLTLYIFKI